MKIREISLMVTGAIVAVTAIVFAFAFFYPTKAQAQASSAVQAPGSVSMVVSMGNGTVSGGGNGGQGGVIAMQDPATRTVTVVAYSFNIWSSSTSAIRPNILLSTNATFTY